MAGQQQKFSKIIVITNKALCLDLIVFRYFISVGLKSRDWEYCILNNNWEFYSFSLNVVETVKVCKDSSVIFYQNKHSPLQH